MPPTTMFTLLSREIACRWFEVLQLEFLKCRLSSNGVGGPDAGEGGRASLLGGDVVHHISQLRQLVILHAREHPGSNVCVMHTL